MAGSERDKQTSSSDSTTVSSSKHGLRPPPTADGNGNGSTISLQKAAQDSPVAMDREERGTHFEAWMYAQQGLDYGEQPFRSTAHTILIPARRGAYLTFRPVLTRTRVHAPPAELFGIHNGYNGKGASIRVHPVSPFSIGVNLVDPAPRALDAARISPGLLSVCKDARGSSCTAHPTAAGRALSSGPPPRAARTQLSRASRTRSRWWWCSTASPSRPCSWRSTGTSRSASASPRTRST